MTEETQLRQVGEHLRLHEELKALDIEMVNLCKYGKGLHPHLDTVRKTVLINARSAAKQNPADSNARELFSSIETQEAKRGAYTFSEMEYEVAREWQLVLETYLHDVGLTRMAEREGEWQTDRLEIRRKELKELGKY